MKGKFVFHFKGSSGTYKIIDRNGYQTMAQAQSWARAHNKGSGKQDSKVFKVTERTPPKTKKRKKSSSIFRTGVSIRMPKF